MKTRPSAAYNEGPPPSISNSFSLSFPLLLPLFHPSAPPVPFRRSILPRGPFFPSHISVKSACLPCLPPSAHSFVSGYPGFYLFHSTSSLLGLLQELPACRASSACRHSGSVRATAPIHHPTHANKTHGLPCPSSCIPGLLLLLRPKQRLPTSAHPRHLRPSPTGLPSWCVSREGSLPHLPTSARPYCLQTSTGATSWCIFQRGPRYTS